MCNHIKGHFGGGGHKHASGFKIALSELQWLDEPEGTRYAL